VEPAVETLTCGCGTKYRVPPDSAGKKARCRTCGAEIRLPGAEPLPLIPIEVPHQTSIADDVEAARSSARGLNVGRGFWSDIAWSLLFFVHPPNLVMFVVTWMTFVFQQFGFVMPGIFGGVVMIALILGIVLVGWQITFFMGCLRDAAAGEWELPRGTEFDNILDELAAPLLEFFVTWLCLLLPAAVMLAANYFWLVGIPGWVIAGTAALGVFLWPMSVLCVSIGGVAIFLRVNLMIESVVRTFPIYIAVCLMFGAAIAIALAAGIFGTGILPVPGYVPRSPPAFAIFAAAVQTWALIVAMRVIGLYYHHFKHRFAWSWG